MNWLQLPYPSGYELPGIGYCLVIGGMVLCFMGFIVYRLITATPEALPERSQPPKEQAVEEEGTEPVSRVISKRD